MDSFGGYGLVVVFWSCVPVQSSPVFKVLLFLAVLGSDPLVERERCLNQGHKSVYDLWIWCQRTRPGLIADALRVGRLQRRRTRTKKGVRNI